MGSLYPSGQSRMTLGQVSPQYKEVENYYIHQVNLMESEIVDVNINNNSEQKEMLINEMKSMDSVYVSLQKELKANPNDERIINAMIEHYQTKIEVMNYRTWSSPAHLTCPRSRLRTSSSTRWTASCHARSRRTVTTRSDVRPEHAATGVAPLGAGRGRRALHRGRARGGTLVDRASSWARRTTSPSGWSTPSGPTRRGSPPWCTSRICAGPAADRHPHPRTRAAAGPSTGARRPSLEGCTDVDLGFSPSTNALPIRRLALQVGQSRTVQVAWLRFPQLTVARTVQTYTRLDTTRYRYASGDFEADLTVDDDGFVVDYDEWRRTATAGFGDSPVRGLDASSVRWTAVRQSSR